MIQVKGLDAAIERLEEITASIPTKAKELCQRLTNYGLLLVDISFSGAAYDGPKDVSVFVEEIENGYRIVANGETAVIMEFGAGVTYGYGHPMAADFGMGPGTYPNGKGHWNDPNGWYIPEENGGGHTYGNPPSMTMYNTGKDLRREIETIAREVFAR